MQLAVVLPTIAGPFQLKVFPGSELTHICAIVLIQERTGDEPQVRVGAFAKGDTVMEAEEVQPFAGLVATTV